MISDATLAPGSSKLLDASPLVAARPLTANIVVVALNPSSAASAAVPAISAKDSPAAKEACKLSTAG